MPLVILSYIMANVAYFFVLPLKAINSSNTVAVMFGSKVFGPIGSLILALIVSASCFGALNATTFTSGRLVYAAGKEGYIPAMFGKIGIGRSAEPTINTLRTRNWISKVLAKMFGDEETGLFFTPVNAMALNASLTTCYVLVGEFGPSSQGAESGKAVQNMDHDAYYILLRESVLAEQSSLRTAITDTHRRGVRAGWCTDIFLADTWAG